MNRCETCRYYRPFESNNFKGKCAFAYVTSGELHNTDLDYYPYGPADNQQVLIVYKRYGCVHWKYKPLVQETLIGNRKWRIELNPEIEAYTLEFKNEDGEILARLVNISRKCQSDNIEDIPY